MAYVAKTTYAAYRVSPDSILRAGLDGETTSKGLLVSKHYENVVHVLQITAFMRDDKVYESIASYWHEDKDLEDAPHLERVLYRLCRRAVQALQCRMPLSL